MYKTIYVPVDNSEHSNQAMAHGVAVGQKFGSQMIGCHVYAAKMHDYRFKQMEYTLPDEYLDEVELDRQRKIHDSLITMGLELISDSYLAQMDKLCKETGLEFIPKMMDGKHHVEILKDIEESAYDLTVIGAVGIGRVKDSVIGSVCERVARHADKDVWVVKELPADKTDEHDTILVGVDGSPQSFGALMTAIKLAGHFNKKIEVISVYDPYLHYSVFNGIVNILTDKAAKVFRFEEQNQLHEEIIDTGLAEIYQSHLEVAKKMASDEGVEVSKTLLDGKAYQKILDHARKTKPWLLVVGRVGVHSSEEENGLGSNSENLLRLSPCDVLLTTSLVRPELDVKADESIRWTPEAEDRMTRVPEQVRGVARTAILRLAMEKGHSVISSDVLDDAMDRYMPKSTSNLTERLAGALAVEQAARANMAMCKSCGVTARDANPVRCTVCDGTTFEIITQEMLERIAEVEGGLMEEVTYDGRKLKWSQDSKKALWTMKDAYQRRRAKARVEKTARIRKMSVITLDFARDIIEEETGLKIELPRTVVEMSDAVESETLASPGGDKKLIARDAKKHPLFSHLDWSPEAIERILRVPHGYMRENTQGRIESMLDSRGDRRVEIADVEQGIELGAALMKEMIDNLESQAATAAAESSTDTDKAADYGINPKTIVKRNEDAGPALNEVGVTQRLMNMADDDGSVH